jgi:hypothetical protein
MITKEIRGILYRKVSFTLLDLLHNRLILAEQKLKRRLALQETVLDADETDRVGEKIKNAFDDAIYREEEICKFLSKSHGFPKKELLKHDNSFKRDKPGITRKRLNRYISLAEEIFLSKLQRFC